MRTNLKNGINKLNKINRLEIIRYIFKNRKGNQSNFIRLDLWFFKSEKTDGIFFNSFDCFFASVHPERMSIRETIKFLRK